MSKKESFENVYRDLQSKQTSETNNILEKAKKETSRRNIWTLIVCIIVDIIFISKITGQMPKLAMIVPILIIDIFIFAIFTLIFSKNQRLAQKAFKELAIKEMICNFYDNVDYVPKGQMPQKIYEEAQYKEYYNRYSSDDYIEATINNKYPIKIAEVETEKEETHTDSDGNTTTTTYTIFHGLFAKIAIDKSIQNELKIERNGLFAKNKLEMDSEEFEKYFDVHSTNKIIGMQILTSDVMEMLVEFRNKSQIEYDIAIYNNNIYLRFHTGSMFELTNLKKGLLPEELLKKYYNVLNFTYKLSNKLIDVINEVEI